MITENYNFLLFPTCWRSHDEEGFLLPKIYHPEINHLTEFTDTASGSENQISIANFESMPDDDAGDESPRRCL